MTTAKRRNAGETITETLLAMLVVTLAILMVTGAVVSAARINSRREMGDVSLVAGGADETPDVLVTVKMGDVELQIPVTVYETGNGYCYYE